VVRSSRRRGVGATATSCGFRIATGALVAHTVMTLSGQTKRGDMTSSNLDLFKMALGLEDPWKVTRTDFNAGEPVQVVQTLPVLVEPRPHLRVRTRIVPPGGKLGGHTSRAPKWKPPLRTIETLTR